VYVRERETERETEREREREREREKLDSKKGTDKEMHNLPAKKRENLRQKLFHLWILLNI
jgi:hypothetical protein